MLMATTDNSFECAHCRRTILVADKESLKQKLHASRQNGDGPFCGLCRHLEMAARHAGHGQLVKTEKSIRQILAALKQ